MKINDQMTMKWGKKSKKWKKRSNSCWSRTRGHFRGVFKSINVDNFALTLIIRVIDVNISLSTLIMAKARETHWARENDVVRGQVFDCNNVDGFVGEFYECRAFCGLYRRLWDFRDPRSMMSSNIIQHPFISSMSHHLINHSMFIISFHLHRFIFV